MQALSSHCAGPALAKGDLPSGALPASRDSKRPRREPQQDNIAVASAAPGRQDGAQASNGTAASKEGAESPAAEPAEAAQAQAETEAPPAPAPLYKRPKLRARPGNAEAGKG